jgi:hypothetical protein
VTQQLPPNFLVYKTYGNFRALWRTGQTSLHADSYTGTLLSFFFFFFENTLGGKIFEFPPKRFRDSWLARGDVDHLMHRIAWSRFGHVSESEWSKGGYHNYRPDVGSRSVFRNYEASFSVLRSVFSGF